MPPPAAAREGDGPLTVGYIGDRLFFKIGKESISCNCIGGDLPMRITDAFARFRDEAKAAGAAAERAKIERDDGAICECGHLAGEHYYPMEKWCKYGSITDPEASNAEYEVVKCGCIKYKARAIEGDAK